MNEWKDFLKFIALLIAGMVIGDVWDITWQAAIIAAVISIPLVTIIGYVINRLDK